MFTAPLPLLFIVSSLFLFPLGTMAFSDTADIVRQEQHEAKERPHAFLRKEEMQAATGAPSLFWTHLLELLSEPLQPLLVITPSPVSPASPWLICLDTTSLLPSPLFANLQFSEISPIPASPSPQSSAASIVGKGEVPSAPVALSLDPICDPQRWPAHYLAKASCTLPSLCLLATLCRSRLP